MQNYKDRARDPESWFNAARRNEEIAKFLLRKYNSYHKRLEKQSDDIVQGVDGKNYRLNHRDSDLHRYILMFYGYAVENHLKGHFVKVNSDQIIKSSKNGIPCLSPKITTHKLAKLFKSVFSEEPNKEQKEALEALERAIGAGKYPIEKCADNYWAYTANLDAKVKIARNILKKEVRN